MKLFTLLISAIPLFSEAAGTYAHPRWCELTAKREVGPYVNAAAKFVDMDPILLATGMSSEGFAIKADCSTKQGNLKSKPNDEVSIAEAKTACEPDRFKALNISTIDKAQSKAKPEEWKLAQEYAPDNSRFASIDPVNGFTELLTTRNVIEKTYYGSSWIDDGSDTFGLEYTQLREKNYLPKKFMSSDYQGVNATSLEQMPDFVFMNDESDRNETAKNRFKSNEGSYLNRISRQNPPKGDKGRTHYKTPEAQVFANAALWKHSQDKFNSARKELIAFYRSKGPSSPDYNKAAALDREFSPTENAFWAKAFYNGGQGTQAAAWDLLKQFSDRQWIANDKYLTADPGASLKEVYRNAREVSDSYSEIIKSSECSNLLASRSQGIDTETYYELETSRSSKNNTSSGQASRQ